ncbi:MAG: MOSC domain-containing protein [Rhizobiales bacterium]|nr:MOSC domain-containing protein [Hyphomicrobiales bacterium]
MQLVAVTIFPLKGARGIAVPAADMEPRGLKDDRRWMLVDPRGRCVTQREMPALARLVAEPIPQGIRLSFDGDAAEIEVPSAEADRIPVTIWNSSLLLPEAKPAAKWLSRAFAQPLGLVFQPDDARRPVEDHAEDIDEVSLADGFPILIVTTASFEALRREVGPDLLMSRFRPNLVIDGAAAWEDDGWASIRVGAVEMDVVKPCPRCAVTTVDQERGVFAGDEPLATLRRIRMSGDRRVVGVLFGWNAIPRRLGTVRVGDTVEVIGAREPWPIRPERHAEMA